jgi:hypothetical protein
MTAILEDIALSQVESALNRQQEQMDLLAVLCLMESACQENVSTQCRNDRSIYFQFGTESLMGCSASALLV